MSQQNPYEEYYLRRQPAIAEDMTPSASALCLSEIMPGSMVCFTNEANDATEAASSLPRRYLCVGYVAQAQRLSGLVHAIGTYEADAMAGTSIADRRFQTQHEHRNQSGGAFSFILISVASE